MLLLIPEDSALLLAVRLVARPAGRVMCGHARNVVECPPVVKARRDTLKLVAAQPEGN